jgi:hypothetical protein
MVSNVIAHPYREFEHSGWERAAPSYAGSFEVSTVINRDGNRCQVVQAA